MCQNRSNRAASLPRCEKRMIRYRNSVILFGLHEMSLMFFRVFARHFMGYLIFQIRGFVFFSLVFSVFYFQLHP